MSLTTVPALPKAWEAPDSSSRQLRVRWIVLTSDGPRVIDRPSEMGSLPEATVVLVPWPGQWRTDTFQTTVGDLVERINAEMARRQA